MKEKLSIPVLLDNCEFPYNSLNTYINPVKSFQNKEKLNKLISDHLKDKPKNKEEYEKELIIFGKSYFQIPQDVMLELNEVISQNLKEKNIDYVTVEILPAQVTIKNIRYLKKNQILNVELLAYTTKEEQLKKISSSFKQIKKATNLLKFYKISFGISQLIGLENTSYLDNLETAKAFAKLKPKYVRLNNIYITKNSPYKALYENRKYNSYTIEKLTDLINDIINVYNKNDNISNVKFGYYELKDEEKYYIEDYNEFENIGVRKEALYQVKNKKVIQVGKLNKRYKNDAVLDFGKNVIDGAYSQDLKEIIEQNLWYNALASKIKKLPSKVRAIEIEVNPYELETAMGIDNTNYKKLQQVYELEINFKSNDKLELGKINLNTIK